MSKKKRSFTTPNFKLSSGSNELNTTLAIAFVLTVALWAGFNVMNVTDETAQELEQLANVARVIQ